MGIWIRRNNNKKAGWYFNTYICKLLMATGPVSFMTAMVTIILNTLYASIWLFQSCKIHLLLLGKKRYSTRIAPMKLKRNMIHMRMKQLLKLNFLCNQKYFYSTFHQAMCHMELLMLAVLRIITCFWLESMFDLFLWKMEVMGLCIDVRHVILKSKSDIEFISNWKLFLDYGLVYGFVPHPKYGLLYI